MRTADPARRFLGAGDGVVRLLAGMTGELLRAKNVTPRADVPAPCFQRGEWRPV